MENDRYNILREQNQFNFELSESLFKNIQEMRLLVQEVRHLVDSCGATAIEFTLRQKIAKQEGL